MAFATGTATSHKDLLSRLRTFLTTLAADPWVELEYAVGGAGLSDRLMLKGVGTGGADEIFVGIETFENAGAGYYNWRLGGFSGWDAGLTFTTQPGAMTRPSLTLWNSNMPYWFVANGRRFMVVAKVSTVYVAMYAGFINPYASPQQYPYPLAIGGNLSFLSEPASNSGNWRWAYTGTEIANFPMGLPVNPVSSYQPDACNLRLRKVDGTWWGYAAGGSSAHSNQMSSEPNVGTIWPVSSGMTNLARNLGSTVQYPVLPIILHGNIPDTAGELDGVYMTTGRGLAAEDTFTVGADTYVVIPNVFRATFRDYIAVRLA